MHQRPRLTRITLTFEVDGKTRTQDVDLAKAEALFWTDHSVQHLLSTYYRPDHPGQPKNPSMTEEQVMKLWQAPTGSGTLPVVMMKTPWSSTETFG